ncbi:Ankyrin repeat-containing protein [Maribacter aquivivus]|uniref:Ankyrin repeat-containing protein n=1 Tax=Maribacter aquivivus TaxID=228958 RepID=A0A1M6U4P1_9FLAO|nr:ankyrin repeat domain-containing protein [Maribacter aquivivus]SHK64124.1 Ankyrin repeat-containing protein [Maribacter aquivivus]
MKNLIFVFVVLLSLNCFSQFDDFNNFSNYDAINEDEGIKYFNEKNQGKDSILDYVSIRWLYRKDKLKLLNNVLKNYSFHNNTLKYLFSAVIGDIESFDSNQKGCLPPRFTMKKEDLKERNELLVLIHSKKMVLEHPYSGAVKNGNLPYLEMYLEMYKDEITDKMLDGFLVEAVQHQYIEIVNFLIDYGANPNGTNYYNDQFYAIYRAVKSPEIFNLLISRGADANPEGYGGNTLVHASREGCLEVIDLLLKAGADPNKVFDNGRKKTSALIAAKQWNNFNSKEVLKLLKSN